MATNISVLAEREARAEASKSEADDAWRAAWWATTLALGSIPETHKKEVGAAQAIVREATGQSARWVSKRTVTGRTFIVLGDCEILPPRMAVAVVEAGIPITRAIVGRMVKAERDGMGLRDFVAELTGKGWADTPEGVSPETVQRIIDAQPRMVAEVVADNPKVLREAENKASWAAAGMATEHEPRPAQKKDYDALVESGTNSLSIALAAASAGRWVPSERSEALLYFLTQILGERTAPAGEQADMVGRMLAEIEDYANTGS